MNNEILIEVKDLYQYFPIGHGFAKKKGFIHAVDKVSIKIPKQSVFGVVGESGSGKTTLGRTILRLIDPTYGTIFFNSNDITKVKASQMLQYRRKMQIIPQDPYNSLHPRKLVKTIIGEGLKIHFNLSRQEQYIRVADILSKVGLNEDHMFRYPHEFSGGQRQRISVARSLVLQPSFLVLDEPTSALDVSVQAMILQLLQDLKSSFSLTYLLITHDLAVIDYMSDYVAVMYLGQIMETGTKKDVFTNTAHPYTKLLLESIPNPDPAKKQKRNLIQGEIPNPANPPKGCRFHTRCPYVKDNCVKNEPEETLLGTDHYVKCFYPLSKV